MRKEVAMMVEVSMVVGSVETLVAGVVEVVRAAGGKAADQALAAKDLGLGAATEAS